MSLQTIFEGNNRIPEINAGLLTARTAIVQSMNAVGEMDRFIGTGPFFNAISAFLLAPGLPGIGKTTVDGEEFLIMWEMKVSSTLGNDSVSCTCTYDEGGQNVLIGKSDLLQSAVEPNSTLVSGCEILVINSAGVGADKKFKLQVDGTNVTIRDVKILMQRTLGI